MKAAIPIALATLGAAGITAPPAHAQVSAALADSDVDRVKRVVVYGRDPCPRGTGDEIIVCARLPETERYRVPQAFRGDARLSDSSSWAARARSLEYIGQTGISSCSTVGPAGFTGCWEQIMREAREERTPAGSVID